MKKSLVTVASVIVVCGAAYAVLTRSDSSAGRAPALKGAPAGVSLVARGEYLTKMADCAACHTTPLGRPFAGGVAFVLPFGTIYSSNITADTATGIGRWSDDEFVRAMHDGIRNDGQRLYPAFPYTAYTALSRGDVLAIKAYLFSLPAASQANREPELGFPFNQRWAMGVWNAAFFKSARFASDPARSEQWNRGAYLGTALGHCAECHTPRNVAFALDHGDELSGAPIQGWRAVNITSDPLHGIGAWSDAEIAGYLSTGHAEGRGSAAGPMGEAVENSLQYLDPDDALALAAWLRTAPPRTGKDPVDVDPRPAPALTSTPAAPASGATPADAIGPRLFAGACASCHEWSGPGRQTPYASLLGSASVNDPEGTNLAQVILRGADLHLRDADVLMPAFARTYSDFEVAALANYVIGHYGAKKGEVTSLKVAQLRASR